MPGNFGDDGARRSDDRVEQTRLADVRPSDDRNLKTFTDETSAFAVGEQRARPSDDVVDRYRERGRIDEMIALLGKIDRRLEPCDEVEEGGVDRPNLPV